MTALHGGTPDRVPICEHLFSTNLQKHFLGYSTPVYEGKEQVQIAKKLGVDTIWTPINGFCGLEEAPHADGELYKDEWGVTYSKSGWPIMAQLNTPVKSAEDWSNYRMPEVDTPYRLKILRDTLKENNGELAVVLGILGPFTMLSWYIVDLEHLSIFMYTEPELIHNINEAYLKWALEVVALAVKEGGIDAVQMSDDWGGTSGLLISPDDFRTFFVPYLKRLVEGINKLGLPAMMHNDGQIWDVLDDLADCGIVSLHPVERAAGMDLKTVKDRYVGRFIPIGNVNNKTTMSIGTLDEVEAETRECLSIGMPGGGYIIATDHSIHDGIPLENIFRFVDTVKKYGVY